MGMVVHIHPIEFMNMITAKGASGADHLHMDMGAHIVPVAFINTNTKTWGGRNCARPMNG